MSAAFRQLGLTMPAADDYPSALTGFFHRRLWQSTVGQLRNDLGDGRQVFAKPSSDRKRFTGKVFVQADDWPLPSMRPSLELWCSEPVNWMSEFRVFVAHKTVVGVRWYDGDPTVEPDSETIRECVVSIDGGLDGYAMDVGVLDSGETAVVEMNEGFAIGTYGLSAEATAQVLIARWKQLTADTPDARA